MKFADLIYETFTSITTNKVRSSLTILGIVIGIASVIVMIAIGKGAQSSIETEIEKIGSNLLMIRPGAQRGPGQHVSQGQGSSQSLKMIDVELIEANIEAAKAVAPVVTEKYQIIAAGENTKTSTTGTTPNYTEIKSIAIEEGTFFTDKQVAKISKVAVLGPDTAVDLFGEGVSAVGKKITINGVIFTVLGTTVSKGGSGFGSQDDVIYIPITTAQQYLVGNDYLSTIEIKVNSQEEMTGAESEIEVLLLAKHGFDDIEDADFSIMNQADIIETASSITGTLTILLGAVAGISLVVGGIGIMNMMLTTVTERTREIGLRKAIGAKADDVTKQFLYESIALTFFGGTIGIVLGYGVAIGIKQFTGLETEVSGFSVALAFGVSTLIGIVFGYYPAKRAAKLNAIEALRYE
ncbi:FtsX-like permease family protein [bacterium]|jgi:putative ABC transport system permease protein|nr:FtsX-like permease family protein [bacterium]MBT4251179.1 FtsX-like permease family protein [bacterium]MBT4598029.1 FtsX-like permease family protein [bacterium]MBT6753559.1 FtsX-like permease family protein [bacterium]MBT7037674.1 FtsX-like permease family protein [bacterium]